MKKKSLLFITQGGMTTASSRLICYENAPYLRRLGWEVSINKGDLKKFDVVVFQKRFSNRDLQRARRVKGKVVLQISEARFIKGAKPQNQVIEFAKHSDGIVVGTDRTRKWFKKRGFSSVVIPTGLDLSKLPASIKKVEPLKICWIGTNYNERYLKHVVEPINRLRQDFDFELRIIGAKPYLGNWSQEPNFIKWKLGDAESKVAECHIGIAPLDTDSVSFSKPPSKLVLYMALKLAVVATSTPPYETLVKSGVNGYLVPNNDSGLWYEYLRSLLEDSEKRREFVRRGFESCKRYDAKNIAKEWDKFLRRL